jgi:predicted dehydrogenase
MNVQEPLRVVRARLAEEPSITTFGEFHVAPRTGDITIPAISLGEPLKAQCEAFLKAVQTGQQPMADVRDGVRVCEIAEAAERSAADGGAPVPVAPHTA